MTEKEKLFAKIDEKENEIIEFVSSLIKEHPVNPAYSNEFDESNAQKIIKNKLNKLNNIDINEFDVNLDNLESYRDSPGFITDFTDKLSWKNRPNILACLPGKNPEKGKSLILTGHVDVVAADNVSEWKYAPFDGVIKDNLLYGRGSVDMLSGLGAMLMALETIAEADIELNGDLWFSSSVGEEAGGTGFLATADYINNNNIDIDAGIMGEPTNLDLSLLCRGILKGELIIEGRTGHLEVAQPHWSNGGAVDAIEKSRYVMNAIDELNKEWSTREDKNHPLMVESNQIKIAKIEGGHQLSSYSDYCKLSFNIQVLPQESNEKGMGDGVKKEFETFIHRIAESDDWLRETPPKINWISESNNSEVSEDHPFIDIFKNTINNLNPSMKVIGSGFHTDTGWLDRLGNIPTVNFGPGNQNLAHVTDEHCNVKDIIQFTKIIVETCLEWCNS